MAQQNIRWQQRFANYRKALVKLTQAVDLLSKQTGGETVVDELLQEGLIQRFEYTVKKGIQKLLVQHRNTYIPCGIAEKVRL